MLYLLLLPFSFFVVVELLNYSAGGRVSVSDSLHFSRVLYLKLFHMLQQHFTGTWVSNMIKHNALRLINIISCSLDFFFLNSNTLCVSLPFLCCFRYAR